MKDYVTRRALDIEKREGKKKTTKKQKRAIWSAGVLQEKLQSGSQSKQL